MRNFLRPIKLMILLISINGSEIFSQVNSKGLTLKIEDLKKVEPNAITSWTNVMTSWTVKSILTNTSRDTLFYFTISGCESSFYGAIAHGAMSNNVSVIVLYEHEKCDTSKQIVIALPPSGQRVVNFLIGSSQIIKSPFKFEVYMDIAKAKNINERFDNKFLRKKGNDRHVFLISNKIKA